MKKLLYLTILLLCFGCKECQQKPTTNSPSKISNAPHVPNQIILDAQDLGSNYAVVKQFLDSNGFKKIDSCNCSNSIELWKSDQDVNVIGKISDASSSGAGVMNGQAWRLTPNFVLTPPVVSRQDTPRQDFRKPTQASTGSKIKIAIIDTGIDSTNVYINGLLWRRTTPASCATEGVLGLNASNPTKPEPLDLQGHGTHLNGIIGGMPFNSGTQGNTTFELLNVKFTTDGTGTGDLFKAICGMYYALDRGVQVMNLSWGYAGGEAPELINSFLKTAKSKNVVIVAGAGNFNSNNDSLKFWPASFSEKYDFVLSVGAYDANVSPLKLYNMTNFGGTVSVFAPGVNVPSAFLGNSTVATSSGTSMAAAYVTRVAAILKVALGLTPAQVKAFIIANSPPQMIDGKPVRFFKADDVLNAGSI